jgi:hypothetical protein
MAWKASRQSAASQMITVFPRLYLCNRNPLKPSASGNLGR